MSTYLYREGGSTRVRRTNLASPPKPVNGTPDVNPYTTVPAGAGTGGAITAEVVASSSTPDRDPFRVRWTTAPSSAGTTDLVRATAIEPVTPGQWVGFMFNITSAQLDVSYIPQLQFLTADSVGAGSIQGEIVTVGSSERWLSVAGMVPAGAAQVRFDIDRAPASPLWTVGSGYDLREHFVVEGDTEGSVRGALSEGYFDGDTPPSGLYTYEWTGTADASTSVELEPDFTLSPTLVIDYVHQRNTGVTAHDTILGGPPVIVRLASRRAQRGTLELYCQSEQLALDVADMCDGSTNVVLVSDDVPGAPYTFCPLDDVRVTWNAGYTSWVVSVPYVKVTFP